jgi:hypothetical protein
MPYNVPPSPKIYLRYYDLCHKLAWGFSSALCLNSHGCCQEPKVVALHGIQTGCSRNNSRCKINNFLFQFGQPRSPKFPDYDTIFCSFVLDYLNYICYYFCNLRLLYSASPFSLADLGIRGFGGFFCDFSSFYAVKSFVHHSTYYGLELMSTPITSPGRLGGQKVMATLAIRESIIHY